MTRRPEISSGSSPPVTFARSHRIAAMSVNTSNTSFIRLQSKKLAGAGVFLGKPMDELSSQTATRIHRVSEG